MSKSQKLSKSKKSKDKNCQKLSKIRNLPKFDAKKAKSNFLTFGITKTFNYLQLACTQNLIFWHFDLKCHIWIETNVLSYAINKVLN